MAVTPLSEAQRHALEVTRELIKRGAPVFIAKPALDADGVWDPKAGMGGYQLPLRWQRTKPDPGVVDEWQPGDALCMVTGVVLDLVDIDTQKGGSADAVPFFMSLGCASTPSGGTHEFIAPLHVRSLDGVAAGVDVKSGLPDGHGRGFAFLAPTVKASKVTGELAEYVWCGELHLDAIDGQPDPSNAELADLINSRRALVVTSYDGPGYAELDEDQRAEADLYVLDQVTYWRSKLAEAATWEDGETDDRFRGWERLTADFTWSLTSMVVTPWLNLTEVRAEQLYAEVLPSVMADDPKCSGKWAPTLRKAMREPSYDPPPWAVDGTDPAGDLGSGIAGLFDSSKQLKHIQAAAHSRGVSAMNVMAWMLAEMLMGTPHDLYLPPVVGGRASMNLGFALVGDSGAGKSAAQAVARDLMPEALYPDDDIQPIGTGEGVVDQFCDWTDVGDEKQKLVLMPVAGSACVFTADEGESFKRLAEGRNGATLGEVIRTGLTGGKLGFTNTKTGGRKRVVPGNSYRMLMMINIHPDQADVLLAGNGVGTPQRFLWVPSNDPTMPETVEELPEWPGQLPWFPPEVPEGDIQYPEHIAYEIKDQRLKQARGEGDPRNGHRMLVQLKVAYALAMLHGQAVIDDQWWALAGRLLDLSFQVQDMCFERMGKNKLKGRVAQLDVEHTAAGMSVEGRIQEAALAVVKKLQATPGQPKTWSEARPSYKRRQGLEAAEIVDLVRQQIGITVQEAVDPIRGTQQWTMCFDPTG
jgi:hypothetical protein